MKDWIVELLACPECGCYLRAESQERANDEVKTGTLHCRVCPAVYPIIDYIPRFVPLDNYARSFGFQWSRHARTQLDRVSGTTISADRFFLDTGWPRRLAGSRMLEAGCGAGRFTEVAIATGAEVFSFDYSRAVEVNLANNGLRPNLHLFQADVYHMPFRPGLFDYVFCFGVIQHTPDPRASFGRLVPQVRPGGRLAVDVYTKRRGTYLKPKYFLRGLTKRIDPERLYRWVVWLVPRLWPVKARVKRLPGIGRVAQHLIPIAYYGDTLPLTPRQQIEWSILDTFDMLAPRYDQPQSLRDFAAWFRRPDLDAVAVGRGCNGYVGRARRAPRAVTASRPDDPPDEDAIKPAARAARTGRP